MSRLRVIAILAWDRISFRRAFRITARLRMMIRREHEKRIRVCTWIWCRPRAWHREIYQ